MLSTHRLATLGAGLALSLASNVAIAQEKELFTDLPVSRAVLFSSGVGFFEHKGTVEGDSSVRLMFKTDQINDILKSMVLFDEGGTVTSVTYASNDPVERTLRSFGVDISGEPSLPDLLKQLRGAEVTVDKVIGKILGVEQEERIVGQPEAKITEHILRLVTATGVQSVKLSAVQNLTFNDPKMQQELNEALGLLIGARDRDRKPVDIRFVGRGKRNVRIGYLVESPVWKTAYRLDLTDKEKPLLQGWAIVENTSENDWKNVLLSLVSGRPISFIQDLYTPLYLDRPVVQPELYASLKPRMYEEGIEREGKALALMEGNQDRARGNRLGAAPAAPPAAKGAFFGRGEVAEKAAAGYAPHADATADSKFDLGSSVHSVASGGSVGELFQFSIQHPVNMQRRRSAMLPIVNQAVKAEKISIYNPTQHAQHPLNGVYLINDTGMKLLSGPVTVFDGGNYAGDARIGHLAPNDKRVLSYAMDLAVTVDSSNAQSSAITSGKLVRGVLYVNRMTTYKQTYKVKNKAEQKRTLIVEHPAIGGRNLINPKTFEEKTPTHYRFRVPIDSATTGEFVVEEQQPGSQQIAIIGSSPYTYLNFVQEGAISAAVKAALQKAANLQNELSQFEGQLANLRQQKAVIENGQDRLRKNIETAGRDSTLGKRYLAKLSEEEDTLEKLTTQIDDTQKKVEAKRKELADYVNSLDLQ